MSKSKPIPALLSDLNAMLLMTGCDYSDVLLIAAQDLTRQAATIADLRERHEAFVREIQDEALRGEDFLSLDGRNRNWLAYNRFSGILAHCSAELGKENSNGS